MLDTIRQMQAPMLDSGWRIRWIGTLPSAIPVHTPLSFTLSLSGAVGFPGCILLALVLHLPLFVLGSIASLALIILGMWTARRAQRADWEPVQARVLDSEVREFTTSRRTLWLCRLVCEFEHGGTTRTITPQVADNSHTTREKLMAYLDQHIGPDGRCGLMIDPKDPRRAYFPAVPRV